MQVQIHIVRFATFLDLPDHRQGEGIAPGSDVRPAGL